MQTSDAQYDAAIRVAMGHSYHDGVGGWNATGVRWYVKWKLARNLDPFDLAPPDAPWARKMKDYFEFLRYMIWLVQFKDPPVNSETAEGYGSTLQSWLEREIGHRIFTPDHSRRLKNLLKGICAMRGGKPGKKKRKPMSPEKLAAAMLSCLDPNIVLHANLRAALACGLQMLLRGSEIGRGDGKAWSKAFNLARGDLKVAMDRSALTAMLSPAKKTIRSTKCVPVTVGAGGKHIDAVREVLNLQQVDPVSANLAESTPAFRDKDGKAFSVSALSRYIKALMRHIGEDPADYSSHCLRIGGATALYKLNASSAIIMTMGRWDSNCFMEYIRADHEAAMAWTTAIGDTSITTELEFRCLEAFDIANEEDDIELELP